eukprot:COSAG02_NODE_317_length_24808_cov_120.564329_6_plen_81_part_00
MALVSTTCTEDVQVRCCYVDWLRSSGSLRIDVWRRNRADLGAGFQPAKYQLGGNSYPKTLAWIAAKVALLAPTADGIGLQ